MRIPALAVFKALATISQVEIQRLFVRTKSLVWGDIKR
jgi:hypothetical protein